jgi:hypothetical protein
MKYSTSITFKNKFRKYFINNYILKCSNIYKQNFKIKKIFRNLTNKTP